MRWALELLRAIIVNDEYLDTKENNDTLERAVEDLEYYDKLRLLHRIVEGCPEVDGGSILDAWEQLCPPCQPRETKNNGGTL